MLVAAGGPARGERERDALRLQHNRIKKGVKSRKDCRKESTQGLL